MPPPSSPSKRSFFCPANSQRHVYSVVDETAAITSPVSEPASRRSEPTSPTSPIRQMVSHFSPGERRGGQSRQGSAAPKGRVARGRLIREGSAVEESLGLGKRRRRGSTVEESIVAGAARHLQKSELAPAASRAIKVSQSASPVCSSRDKHSRPPGVPRLPLHRVMLVRDTYLSPMKLQKGNLSSLSLECESPPTSDEDGLASPLPTVIDLKFPKAVSLLVQGKKGKTHRSKKRVHLPPATKVGGVGATSPELAPLSPQVLLPPPYLPPSSRSPRQASLPKDFDSHSPRPFPLIASLADEYNSPARSFMCQIVSYFSAPSALSCISCSGTPPGPTPPGDWIEAVGAPPPSFVEVKM